jgi:Region found in RelA / SpoT proteins
VLKLKADRTALPEYARFSGLWCEVQVQTTLNHAWSEMEHDIIYKKPVLEGFGGKLFEAIEQRLQKIMKAHLLPAGYEFQKVLDDYERLQSGKKLFDRGALKALAKCSDNNARHELLERFRDYVLPNYDDPQSVYPEIKDQLVAAVAAARLTKPRPIETPFGNYPGITVDRVVDVVADNFISKCASAYAAETLTPSHPTAHKPLFTRIKNAGGNIKWLEGNRDYQHLFHRTYCLLRNKEIPFDKVTASPVPARRA